jgi:hypothetical protein
MLRVVTVRISEDEQESILYDVPETECDSDTFSQLIDEVLEMRETCDSDELDGFSTMFEDLMTERGINYDIPDAQFYLRGVQLAYSDYTEDDWR